MKGTISNFRSARHHQYDRQMIIVIDDIDKEKAESLIGKKVIWKTPAGKEIAGRISAVHGNKGAVRAIFEKGMPGQSVGTKVDIE